jgi:hypothetical protein
LPEDSTGSVELQGVPADPGHDERGNTLLADKTVVVSIFEDEASAQAAVVIPKDAVGSHSAGQGAGIGLDR